MTSWTRSATRWPASASRSPASRPAWTEIANILNQQTDASREIAQGISSIAAMTQQSVDQVGDNFQPARCRPPPRGRGTAEYFELFVRQQDPASRQGRSRDLEEAAVRHGSRTRQAEAPMNCPTIIPADWASGTTATPRKTRAAIARSLCWKSRTRCPSARQAGGERLFAAGGSARRLAGNPARGNRVEGCLGLLDELGAITAATNRHAGAHPLVVTMELLTVARSGYGATVAERGLRLAARSRLTAAPPPAPPRIRAQERMPL